MIINLKKKSIIHVNRYYLHFCINKILQYKLEQISKTLKLITVHNLVKTM